MTKLKMANKIEISEFELVDAYFFLELGSSYVHDPEKIRKCLIDIFAYFGLKIINFNLPSFNTIRGRYNRIVAKIKSNQSAKRDRHYGFIPDKQFFSENDFPDLCTNETSTR